MDLVPLNLDYEIHCLLTVRPCSRSLTTFMPLMWDLRKHRHSETRGKPSMLFLRHCCACFLRWGLSLSWILSLMPGWLTSEYQRPTCTASSHRHGFFTGLTDRGIFNHVSWRTSPASEGACCQALGTWVQSPEPTQWKESTDLTSTCGVFLLPCSMTKRFCLFSEYLGIFPKYLYVTMFPFKFTLSDSVPV